MNFIGAPGSSTPTPDLPPLALRMGGEHFKDDQAFISTAVADVHRLQSSAHLTMDTRLLDWGCGAGRLAIGIRHVFGHIRDYHGVDIQKDLVDWAQEHLSDEHTRFSLVGAVNDRYNPGGVGPHNIPADDASVDVFYAYSVFSHMLADDVAIYSKVISRILAPGGRVMLTAFVEEDVQAWQENPPDYGPLAWTGPLHCVRYDRVFLESILRQAGLVVDSFQYGQETDGQSLYLLRHDESRRR